MYAVIKTGGKQYKVSAGEKLKIESIVAEVGSEIVLDQVLLVADGEKVTTGTPLVSGATVKATVVSHGRGEKIKIFKMRRRKHYRKTQGHRQNYTEIQSADQRHHWVGQRSWRTRKQAAVRATGATPTPSGWG